MNANLSIVEEPSAGDEVSAFPVSRIEGDARRFVHVIRSPRFRGSAICLDLMPGEFCPFDSCPDALAKTEPEVMVPFDFDSMRREVEMQIAGWRVDDCNAQSRPMVVIDGINRWVEPAILADAVIGVVHLRALGASSYFRIIVAANASLIDDREVRSALALLTVEDEVRVRLDARCVNEPAGAAVGGRRPGPVLPGVHSLGRIRPVTIQGEFSRIRGMEPSKDHIEALVTCLLELKSGGAKIPLIQICSMTRTMICRECGHLPLASLARIARHIRDGTGLTTEVC